MRNKTNHKNDYQNEFQKLTNKSFHWDFIDQMLSTDGYYG